MKESYFLALDLGSTHFKAGLFSARGLPLRMASQDVQVKQQPEAGAVMDPAWVSAVVDNLIIEVLRGTNPEQVAAIGAASMAETGLLVDRASRTAVTPLFPWFNRSAEGQIAALELGGQPIEQFVWRGVPLSFKSPVARLVWLRDRQEVALEGRIWLSAADFILFSLTGQFATDYSLAGRTGAFRIDRKEWNTHWLEQVNLPLTIFPPAFPAGKVMGRVTAEAAVRTGLQAGIPVTVAGHDHICAALAAGVTRPGPVLDSMGTAEALVGSIPDRPLNPADAATGLMYGCHVVEGQMYWMGSLSSSGGSIEWLRRLFGENTLSYDALQQELSTLPEGPGEIIFLPYLNGSGAPHLDPLARAAWVGLRAGHSRSDLYRAVLEGTAYEMETIRRAAYAVEGVRADRLVAIGGGAQNLAWLQIKADVSGQPIEAPRINEATLAGAALLAGAASGLNPTALTAGEAGADSQRSVLIQPDPERHIRYQAVYENGFMALQPAVRKYAHFLAARNV